MPYVDGFVLPVPKKNIGAYKKLATKASKIWKKHGALQYMECLADDMDAKGLVPFPQIAGTKKGETVVFAFIVYKSRAHRDRVNAAVMKDPALGCMEGTPVPFDCKRMAYGGFNVIVK